jgi:hypothetical protein
MAYATRSAIFAFVPESVEGTPVDPASNNFTVVREGATISGAMNTVSSDELRNSIGASKAFATSQAPTGSIPKYLKPSGVAGQAPDYGILIQSCLGGVDVNSTEYSTAASSTAGTTSARAKLKVTAGVEANYQAGQGLLIKDGTNGYKVRNVYSNAVSTELALSFNLNAAPAASVGLGKAVLYYPSDVDQPTFTAHWYQAASSGSGVHLAMAGTRTTAMNMELTANELGGVTFELGGLSFYTNPITITASSKFIDFVDSDGVGSCQLTEKTYSSPMDLADEIASKMTAASVDTISCAWSNATGKFTISSTGSTLSLTWATGTNTANSAKTKLGFTNADDTGSLTYTSDTAQSYAPSVTPAYDDQSPQVVRASEMLLGNFYDHLTVGGSTLAINCGTPKTDIPNFASENGLDESVVLNREVTFSSTIKFEKHNVSTFYSLLNNTEVMLAFTTGSKVAGNWVPGTVVNVFLPTVSLTASTIADQDGYLVVQIEGTAFVGSDMQDIYINFL